MSDFEFIHNSETFHYTSWLRTSMDRCGIRYSVRQDPAMKDEGFCFLRSERRTIGLEWSDTVQWIDPRVEEVELYLKANFSSEFAMVGSMPGECPQQAAENFARFSRFQHIIRPWILGRVVSDQVVEPFPSGERVCTVATYSGGCGKEFRFGQNRERLYGLLTQVLGEEALIAYPGFSGECLIPVMASYSLYLKFLSCGFFALNMVGLRGSNPFRCVDACLARTPVISDYIYADAYKDFPRYHLPCSTFADEMSEERIRKSLLQLHENREEIHRSLVVAQDRWFQKNLAMNVFARNLLERAGF